MENFCQRLPGKGFPGSSAGKESACSAGDPGLISGSGRSPGEGIGYPLQYPWACLVAQMVKNPPTMWETWVWFLGQEDSLEKGKATQSSILAWRTEEPGGLRSMQRLGQRVGRKESDKRTIYYNFSKRHLSQGDCHLLDFCSNRLLISVIMFGPYN